MSQTSMYAPVQLLSASRQNLWRLTLIRLLVLAAMNLCSQQIELQQAHQEALDRYQEQVSATVDVIERTLGQS